MLEHIQVLDLSDERGQLCGHLLASLGAEVIAVEPPGGTRTRRLGPFADDASDPDRSLTHWAYNRGKLSVEIDLTTDEGRARLRELAAGADVLVESAGAGVMADAGLGPDDLAAANPALVYASISAFGQTGPKARWAESDLIVGAAAGVVAITGYEDRAPLRITLPQAYHHAAIDALCGILAALHDRQNNSGLGQHIDISAQTSFNVATQSFMLNGPCEVDPPRRTAGGATIPGIDAKIQLLWPCKDGQVSVTFLFGAALGPATRSLMEWIHEEGFCDEATRDKDWIFYGNMLFDGSEPIEEYERVKGVVGEFMLTKTKQELIDAAFERRVLLAPVTTGEDVVTSEHWASRDTWDDVVVAGRQVRFPGAFATFSQTPLAILGAPPVVGEHTDAVLTRPRRRPDVPAVTGTAPPRPLEGLKIADFSWVFAGPYATRMMADLGADVIRVDSTHAQDALRTAGTFQENNIDPDWAVQYANINASKRGFTMDMGRPEARDVVHDLVRWGDVVMESFSPKAMTKWGYDYESLRRIKPDLVMASSCLMGQTGPQATLAGYGTMAAAISGFFHITGWPDLPPCGPFVAYTDYVSPRFFMTAVLAAVEHRRRTGEGQYIDLSQAQASMQLQAPALLEYTVNGRIYERDGNADPAMSPHGVYPTAGDDNWIAIAARDDDWATLCGRMGRSDLAGWTLERRIADRETVDEAVGAWTAGFDGNGLMHELQDAGVAAHVVQNSNECWHDPQLAHREHVISVPHEAMGRSWIENCRIHLSRTPARVDVGSPTLGQHTWEVLTEVLGYDEDAAAELLATGIFE